jgi:hypothetical protein
MGSRQQSGPPKVMQNVMGLAYSSMLTSLPSSQSARKTYTFRYGRPSAAVNWPLVCANEVLPWSGACWCWGGALWWVIWWARRSPSSRTRAAICSARPRSQVPSSTISARFPGMRRSSSGRGGVGDPARQEVGPIRVRAGAQHRHLLGDLPVHDLRDRLRGVGRVVGEGAFRGPRAEQLDRFDAGVADLVQDTGEFGPGLVGEDLLGVARECRTDHSSEREHR